MKPSLWSHVATRWRFIHAMTGVHKESFVYFAVQMRVPLSKKCMFLSSSFFFKTIAVPLDSSERSFARNPDFIFHIQTYGLRCLSLSFFQFYFFLIQTGFFAESCQKWLCVDTVKNLYLSCGSVWFHFLWHLELFFQTFLMVLLAVSSAIYVLYFSPCCD